MSAIKKFFKRSSTKSSSGNSTNNRVFEPFYNKINKNREIVQIGSGSYGKIYKICGSKRCYILKSQTYSDASIRESHVLKKLKRKSYVPQIALEQIIPETKKHTIIMHHSEGFVNVMDFIADHPNVTINKLIKFMVNALGVLKRFHKAGFAHLDIKPENILVHPTSMDVQLIDFGLAYYKGVSPKLTRGTIKYICPTRANMSFNKPNFSKMSHQQLLKIAQDSDVWAMAVVLFVVYERRVPSWFKKKKDNDKLAALAQVDGVNVSDTIPKFLNSNSNTKDMKHIVVAFVLHSLTRKDPSKRVSVNKAISMLKDVQQVNK